MMAVFIEQATPFIEEFLEQIFDTKYPKSKIHLVLRNTVDYHEKQVDAFFQSHSKEYASAKRIKPSDFITEEEARKIAMWVIITLIIYLSLKFLSVRKCEEAFLYGSTKSAPSRHKFCVHSVHIPK